MGCAVSVIIDMLAKTSRSLDARAQPEEVVADTDVSEVPKLTRLLTRILRDVADLKRRFAPRVHTYINLDVDNTGTTVYRLAHRFGGPVAWSPVEWVTSSAAGPSLEEHASGDKDTLAIVSHVAGRVAIRVEELG